MPKKKSPELQPTEKQTRKLQRLAKGVSSETDFNKRFSHVKDEKSLALIRKWIQPYVKF